MFDELVSATPFAAFRMTNVRLMESLPCLLGTAHTALDLDDRRAIVGSEMKGRLAVMTTHERSLIRSCWQSPPVFVGMSVLYPIS